jgi:hypothetical protein
MGRLFCHLARAALVPHYQAGSPFFTVRQEKALQPSAISGINISNQQRLPHDVPPK